VLTVFAALAGSGVAVTEGEPEEDGRGGKQDQAQHGYHRPGEGPGEIQRGRPEPAGQGFRSLIVGGLAE
jgi:hypothetical protein